MPLPEDTPQPGSAPRSINPGASRQGITETLTAPGRVMMSGASRGAAMAEQLERALGLAGRAVAGIVSIAAEEKQRHDIVERGLGHRDSDTDAAGFEDRIVNRELLLPDGADPGAYAQTLAGQQAEGRSDAYTHAYVNSLTPRLADAFVRQQRGMKKENDTVLLASAKASVHHAQSPVEIKEAVDELGILIPSLTDKDKLAVVLEVARTHALNGDTLRLESTMDVLGDAFPAERAEITALYAHEIEQRKRAIESTALEDLAGQKIGGKPIASRRDFVTADPRFDQVTREKLLGDLEIEERQVGDTTRRVLTNTYKLRAMREDPSLTKDFVLGEAETGKISAEEAHAILGLMQQKKKIDSEARLVAGLRDAGKVITPNLAGGYMRYLADKGVVSAALDTDGGYIYAGILNPERAGDEFAAAGFVLPQASEQIAHAFSTSQTMDHMQAEARTYAAIAEANPLLAESIRQQMSDAGKTRSDGLIAQLHTGGRPETLTLNPIGQPDSNPAYVKRVQEVLGDKRLLEAKGVELTGQQAQAILWNGGRPASGTNHFTGRAMGDIEKKLPEGLNDNFRFGFGRDVSISLMAVSDYQAMAEKELRVALALQPNEHKAADRAKKTAVLAILNKRPPVLWNGLVRVGPEAPYAFDEGMGTEMLGDLKQAIKDGYLTQSLSFYEDNYTPAWLPDRKVAGSARPGAWTLIDAAGLPLTLGKQEFLWHPTVETFEKMSERIEREGREAFNRRNAPSASEQARMREIAREIDGVSGPRYRPAPSKP